MGNPFQVKLSQMLSAANTDLPRLEALLYLCCSHASLRCPYTQKPVSYTHLIRVRFSPLIRMRHNSQTSLQRNQIFL